MNSINENQPEDNKESLFGTEAGKKIKELAEKASTCFFCTVPAQGDPKGTRPMSVRRADEDGTLWFLSASDSFTNLEIESNPYVTLYFQGSAHSDFMMLKAKASISTDKEKIKDLWTPLLKTWFTGGEDDPRITVLKVLPENGYYWDTKHGMFVAGIKMMVGALTGKTLDDSVEGELKI